MITNFRKRQPSYPTVNVYPLSVKSQVYAFAAKSQVYSLPVKSLMCLMKL